MSKEYYKRRIVDLRVSIAKEKEAKKKDNEYYTRLIKSASTPFSKASYRKNKIDKEWVDKNNELNEFYQF